MALLRRVLMPVRLRSLTVKSRVWRGCERRERRHSLERGRGRTWEAAGA